MTNILRLYQDFSIRYWPEGSKNVSPGWVNIQCVFCDDSSNHLGFHLTERFFNCWRCGPKLSIRTIEKLLNVSQSRARALSLQYNVLGGGTATPVRSSRVTVKGKPHKLPSGTGPLSSLHLSYLEGRGYDARKIEREWGLLGTGPVSLLDDFDYKHRIIAPIRWDNRRVSFQSRSVIAGAEPKYKACPKSREEVHHKSILYGKQSEWGETGICVEGITDVWRLGPSSFATFGIEYTRAQARAIAASFRRVAVLFDAGEQAQEQAAKLVDAIGFWGGEAWLECTGTEGDPADLSQEEADAIVRSITGAT